MSRLEEYARCERERIAELLEMIDEFWVLRKIFLYSLDVMEIKKNKSQKTDNRTTGQKSTATGS